MNLGNRNSQMSVAKVPQANVARSRFDRSFAVKDTFNFDYLVPFFIDEMLPGDTANINVKTFARLAPQVVPFLDNAYLDFFFFSVPMRLVWDNWEKFNGAQENPNDPTDYLIPQVVSPSVTGWAVNSIYDHFGVPTGVPDLSINVLPFRAYNLIWNEWFRDQNLQSSLTISKGDGPDNQANYTLRLRAKKHDYFTSALPWPQKGDAVTLPLATTAEVWGSGDSQLISGTSNKAPIVGSFANRATTDGMISGPLRTAYTSGATVPTNYPTRQGSLLYPGSGAIAATEDNDFVFLNETLSKAARADAQAPWYADLSEASAVTINQLRQAMMMQSLLELDARGGTRYTEILKAHFNVISPDFRLQRPEFLGAASTRIQQHPVAQTSGTTEDGTPQGNLAAFSTQAEFGNKIGFTKSFDEHCYVIGLVQARGDITYQQGLNRLWSRETRWDFFWPKFQELGEQTILNKEIYTQGPGVTNPNGIVDDQVFGYQERHAEYRYRPSEIRGQFRSTYSESLDVWHLAQEFSALPVLNNEFIASSTPIERSLVVPDPDYPDILMDAWFDYKHARPIVTYGVPATLGRF